MERRKRSDFDRFQGLTITIADIEEFFCLKQSFYVRKVFNFHRIFLFLKFLVLIKLFSLQSFKFQSKFFRIKS